jgi:hypothetical protein
LSLFLAATDGQAALAQSISPYSYMYLGQSLMYPLSRVFSLPFMYGPYNSNPFYSMNSYLRPSNSWPNVYPFTNATYGPWGYRNAGMPPGYFNTGTNNIGNSQYPARAQDEPDNADPAANTMNSANPYQSPPPPSYTHPPASVPSSGGAPGGLTSGGYPPSASTAPGSAFATGVGTAPPATPSAVSQVPRSELNTHPPASVHPSSPLQPPSSAVSAASSASLSSSSASVPSSAAPSAVPAAGSAAAALLGQSANPGPGSAVGRPLAEGFINHLNGNYQGDMSKALSNTDTRSWARAMGIIGDDVQDGSHLSSDRLEVIGRVLKDNTLDPVSKLDTMRILLKKSTPTGN